MNNFRDFQIGEVRPNRIIEENQSVQAPVQVNEEDYDADQIEETKERAEFVVNILSMDESDDSEDGDFFEFPTVLEAQYCDSIRKRRVPHSNALSTRIGK